MKCCTIRQGGGGEVHWFIGYSFFSPQFPLSIGQVDPNTLLQNSTGFLMYAFENCNLDGHSIFEACQRFASEVVHSFFLMVVFDTSTPTSWRVLLIC